MKDELRYIWQSNESVRGADGRVSSHPPLGGAGLLCLGKERGPTGDGRAAEHCLSIPSILSTCINLGAVTHCLMFSCRKRLERKWVV